MKEEYGNATLCKKMSDFDEYGTFTLFVNS